MYYGIIHFVVSHFVVSCFVVIHFVGVPSIVMYSKQANNKSLALVLSTGMNSSQFEKIRIIMNFFRAQNFLVWCRS